MLLYDASEDESAFEDETTASETASTIATESTTKSKKKQKRKRKKRDVSTQVFVSEYVDYEEDEEAEDPGMSNGEFVGSFLKRLQRLADIMAVIKPSKKGAKDKKHKKDKKKKKMETEDKEDKSAEKEKRLSVGATEELEREKNRLIRELQEEIEDEEFNSEVKSRVERQQMRQRNKQLEKSWYRVDERKKAFMDFLLHCLENEEWLRYMSCDGLPDPAVLSELNTFLFLWSLEDARASMKTLPRQCEIVIYLIRKLDEIIEFSLQKVSVYIEDCKQIRQKYREKLQCWIDMASYCLLRQIERDTIRVDLKNASYVQQLTPLVCCFWAFIRLPISIKQIAEKDRKPVEVAFEEVGLTIKMPLDVDCHCTAMRVLWLGYDHYSDLTASFHAPQLPEEFRMETDLLTFCKREFELLEDIREEQSEARQQRIEQKRSMIRKILYPPSSASAAPSKDRKSKRGAAKKAAAAAATAAPQQEEEKEVAPPPQMVKPEEIILAKEDEIRKETRRLLFTRCKKTEINLRKYAILGGLYRIDLINQPPQPKDMRRDIFLTTLQLPKELEFVKFSRPYKAPPPAPDSERTPEVIEAEMKALEAAMEALALVTLKLPDSVMWFEPPLVAHWLPEERVWSTEDVHDIKYNEEKQTITFRTGRLGLHGLAGYRFVNLPFQSWELKPETGKSSEGGVILSITGAIIQLEFLVREDLVCLHSIVGGGSTALQDLMNNYMRLHILILKMRGAGCDVFPETDAASYLKGLALKHPVAGRHLQACMGLLSTAYVFSWSRWNATRPPREIAMQIKEVHGCMAKLRSNAIMVVTPWRTTVVKCSEVSSEFSDEPADPNNLFYSDVYHYALHNAGIKSRLAMQNMSFKLSTTVTNLLEATNIINYSA